MLGAQGLPPLWVGSIERHRPFLVISSEAKNLLHADAAKQQVPFDFAQGRLSSHSLFGMTIAEGH